MGLIQAAAVCVVAPMVASAATNAVSEAELVEVFGEPLELLGRLHAVGVLIAGRLVGEVEVVHVAPVLPAGQHGDLVGLFGGAHRAGEAERGREGRKCFRVVHVHPLRLPERQTVGLHESKMRSKGGESVHWIVHLSCYFSSFKVFIYK